MRILEICNHFPPTIGGSETHNFSVVKYLHQQGHDIEVIVIRDLPGIRAVKSYENVIDDIIADKFVHPELTGVHIHNVGLKSYRFPQSYTRYFHIWQIIRRAERERGPFEVIGIHTLPYAIPISRYRKVVLSVHSFEIGCATFPSPAQCRKPSTGRCKCVSLKRYWHWRFINVFCLPKVDKIMVKYNYMGKSLVQSGVAKNKISLVPHWMDYEKIQHQIQESSVSNLIQKPDVFTFGFLGRLDEFKGILLITQALKLLLDKGIKAHLLVIGDGQLRPDLEAYCKEHRMLQNVTFAGYIPHEKVPSYFSLADAFVVGSPYDNYNWALLELMCTRKPIVATNTGGTCDILVDEGNAFLAEPTPSSIAARMKHVLENPDLANRAAENAFKTVREKHSLDNLKKYEELLINTTRAKNE